MDDPLGTAVGNSLEIAESIKSLRNQGPQDLLELTCALGKYLTTKHCIASQVKIERNSTTLLKLSLIFIGGKLLAMVGKEGSLEKGQDRIRTAISSGSALAKFKEMLIGQGTEVGVAHELCYGDIWKHLPKAEKVIRVLAPVSGES